MSSEEELILSEFLKRVAPISKSIVLIGSYAIGNAQKHSDIDLIIIVNNPNESQDINSISNEMNKSQQKPFFDCKVWEGCYPDEHGQSPC